jgi:hypothetical protein
MGAGTPGDLPSRYIPVIPDGSVLMGTLQLTLSALFLFLFLLAVRNHFRIK